MRWEKRTRLFLRTTEFLWQEGHTAHAKSQEAMDETLLMLNTYKQFAEETLAIPVIHGIKSESEKFAGAVHTYAIEALMQDGKSLQAGTSHFLGQKFAKAFDVTFQNKDRELEFVWASSWGVSTRLIGGVIMTHSDDNGLIVPPKIAPTQAVIIPIYKTENKASVLATAETIKKALSQQYRIVFDDDDENSPGWKFAEWELRGVPVRIELGPKDIEKKQVIMVRRDTREKIPVAFSDIAHTLQTILDTMQHNLLIKARAFTEKHSHHIDTLDAFTAQLSSDIPGYIYAPWDGTEESERKIKELTKASIRIITEETPDKGLTCIYSGAPAKHIAVFAKAY